MWHIRDDLEQQAIRDLFTSSDRAAAIVAATIVEARLIMALQSRFKNNDKAIVNEMFRSSGPLGSFSAKIKLAYLLGICSDRANNDLEIMKDIRNRFAHRLDVRDFNSQRITTWCQNLKLVDISVFEKGTEDPKVDHKPGDWFTVENRDEKLKDAKWRYLLTAMLFSGSLALTRSQGMPNI